MKAFIYSTLVSVCALVVSPNVGANGPAPSVESIRLSAPLPGRVPPTLLLPQPSQGLVKQIVLPPVSVAELDALVERNRHQKRFEIGIGRPLPDNTSRIAFATLPWRPLRDGSQVATVQFFSPDAVALRAAIELRDLPQGVEMRFYGPQDPATVYGPFDLVLMRRILNPTGKSDSGSVYWSPVIEGDVLAVEIQTSSVASLATGSLHIPQLSHLFYSAQSEKKSKNLSDIGSSGACNVDIACEADSNWRVMGESVAKYVLTDSDGATGLCTGTLLNDTKSSFTPNFLTANHCISKQSEASTVQTYWFFQRQSCGGASPSSVTTRVNGGILRATGTSTDFTLLELNDTPPPGVVFSGWDANTTTSGSVITGIHHPSGDLKKISHGDIHGISQHCSMNGNSAGTHIRVNWSVSGTTEQGSSGSALFNNSRQVVGNLHGGGAACVGSANNGQPDWYGRFDKTYNCLTPWLGGTPTGACLADNDTIDIQSGVTVPNTICEETWHRYKLQSASSSTGVRVQLQNLTADADLYVRRNAVPDLTTFDCKSINSGTSSDSCEIAFNGAAVWYVSVYGFENADYSLTATELGPSSSGSGGGGGGAFSIWTTLVLTLLGWLMVWLRR